MTAAPASETIAWAGNDGLRQMLVPIGTLHAHPRNPRRGDVERIRESLRRFGQQRPILALPDATIVAGHHVWKAALAEEWTHVAVVYSDLSENEVEAYLLADNRLSDLGFYDEMGLGELLGPFYETDDLAGLGWTQEEVATLLAQLDGWTIPIGEEPPRLDQLGTRVEGGRAYTLLYSDEDADEFERLAAAAGTILGTPNLPATVLAALRRVE